MAGALHERASRIYQQYGNVMLEVKGMTKAGVERKATCRALFSKLLYLQGELHRALGWPQHCNERILLGSHLGDMWQWGLRVTSQSPCLSTFTCSMPCTF